LLIETCIRNHELLPVLKKVGYSVSFLDEDSQYSYKYLRKTIIASNLKDFRNSVNLVNKKRMIFLKPLSKEVLRYGIISNKVIGIVIDDSNFKILRKSALNLLRQYNKFVEIPLPNSSSYLLYRIIPLSYKWFNVIFSSYSRDLNEIWTPISKLNYLVIHGADEEEALRWIYDNPLKLLIHVSNSY
jgi:ribonuclease P/MRP protein subunit RPP1